MTREDNDLLLKDLCSRLPYGVKFMIDETYLTEDMIKGGYDKTQELYGITYEGNVELLNMDYHMPSESIKPYLFPLSSMTEEQYYEMNGCSSEDCLDHMEILKSLRECTDFTHWPLYEYRVIDWLNKNHFDYRGLIEKGLAINATYKNIY